MRNVLPVTIFWLGCAVATTACGSSPEPTGEAAEREAEETIRRAAAGEKVEATRSGLAPCEILREAGVGEVFAVDAAAIEYLPGSSRNPICTARWRKPDADAIEAESPQRMMDYMTRKIEAQQRGEPFEEKMPVARSENEAHLTLANTSLVDAAAAVEQLETLVARLTEGITVEVQGKEHTTQAAYDDWLPGVGDKAAWSPQLSQLSVAAKGVVYHVGVKVSDDAAENRESAIELARRVAQAL